MKKLILILAICASTSTLFAQTAFKNTASNPTGTLTDNGSDTCYYRTSQSYSVVSIQPIITKASGTMAGKSYLYSSVDGTNYILVDSLSNANVTTNTTIWNKTSAARYWRIITGGATTVSATVKAYISAN